MLSAQQRLQQAKDKYLRRYVKYTAQDRKSDEKVGREHGGKEFPESTSRDHPFLESLKNESVSDLLAFGSAVGTIEHDVTARQTILERQRSEDFVLERDRLVNERREKLHEIDNQSGPSSPKFADARKKAQQYEAESRKYSAETGRPCKVKIPTWAYVILLIGVAVCEVPVNQVAFSQIVEGTNAASALVALLVGAIVAMFAHLAGEQISRSTEKPSFRNNWFRYLLVLTLFVVMGVLFYGISLLRELMLSISRTGNASFATLLQQGGVRETFGQLSAVEMTGPGYTLLFLNILIFTFGVIVSFYAHDPHPYYAKAVKNANKWANVVKKMEINHNRVHQKQGSEYDAKINALEKNIALIDGELQQLAQDLPLIKRMRADAASIIAAYVAQRVQAYEVGNRLERKTATPSVFGKFETEAYASDLSQEVGRHAA